MNYKLIHNIDHLQKFIDLLPDLKENEGYFLILIARKKWFPESNIPSAHKLKRETVNDKNKIIQVIRQWEIEEGAYHSGGIPIDIRNLGVYMGYNPKNQLSACYELINKCLSAIRSEQKNINVKSMANDVIQGCNGTKNFIDIDVDIENDENYLDIINFIKGVINEKHLTFIKTNGGFHCLVDLKELKKESDIGNWYKEIELAPFDSDLNIMSNDLIPIPGCNQGKFVPYFLD